MINQIKDLYHKNKELILYLIFGFLTTVVSYAVFFILYTLFNINELISNFFSWVSGVVFAFSTNRKYVFENEDSHIFSSFIKFASGRVFTLLFDEAMIYVFVSLLKYNVFIIKIISSIFVVILNYIISKFFVFKK